MRKLNLHKTQSVETRKNLKNVSDCRENVRDCYFDQVALINNTVLLRVLALITTLFSGNCFAPSMIAAYEKRN